MSGHCAGKTGALLAGQELVNIVTRLRQWHCDSATADVHKSWAATVVIARRVPEEDIDRIAKSLVVDAAEARAEER